VIIASLPLTFTGFFVYTSGGNAGMALWDSADTQGGSWKVYAVGSPLGSGPNSTTTARFYANYTFLASGLPVTGAGVWCNVSFDISGWTSPAAMTYNSTSKMYEYDRTFTSRGLYSWNTTCDGSSQGATALSAIDDINVTNSPAGIYVPLSMQTCYEDTACSYNFAADCFDVDSADSGNLVYGYQAGTQFAGFSMNNVTGNIGVSIGNDNACGTFSVTLLDKDSSGSGATANKSFLVNAINDLPAVTAPSSAYQNTSFYFVVSATDEETPSGPFLYNMTFLSCNRPFNNDHTNLTNCSGLFGMNNISGIINRTSIFKNSDVGSYSINFTASDPGDNLTGTSIPPYTWLANATGSTIVSFSVVDRNDRPIMEPVANQFWSQNQSVTLFVYASDIDNGTLVFNSTTLYRNLTTYVNASLFPIYRNVTFYQDNGTSLANATFNFSRILNSQVGNYTVNISVYDGRVNGTYSILVDFTVSNINDPPSLNFSCVNFSVEGLPYSCSTGGNVTDPDNFPSYVPYTDSVNGSVTFGVSFPNCSKKFNASDTNCTIFGIDPATGVINYSSPQRKDAGNYTVNVSAIDGGNLSSSTVFNFTVIDDYAPQIITAVLPQTTSQNQSFYLEINATDLDSSIDYLYFRSETYYNGTKLNPNKFPIVTNATFWPSLPVAGIMNYSSVNNSQVGNYSVKITVNDSYGREDFVIVNFTVYDLNDPPVLNLSCANFTTEATNYSFTDYECKAGQNSSDPDMLTPYGDNLTFNMTFLSGQPLFSMNSSSGLINFTAWNDTFANNTLNFTYVLNISVTDAAGASDSRILNLTIFAVNDPPTFNFSNLSAYANSTYFENLSSQMSDEENNLPMFYNLTFLSCVKENTSDTNCSVFGINSTSGVINFSALQKDMGNYTINVTVKDAGNSVPPFNATGWRIITFRIRQPNRPPDVNIAGVIPGILFYENDTVVFAIGVSDPDGDPVACAWYRNETQVGSVDPCQNANSWSYTPGFDESGIWPMRLVATDSKMTSSTEIGVVILNRNRPPELIFPVQNQSWNMNTQNRNIILSYNFRDLDNENNVTNDDNNLTVGCTVPAHISVRIDDQPCPVFFAPENWTGKAVVTLTPDPDWYGTESTAFTLNDSQYLVSSNNVTLNVSYTETQSQTVVQQTTGGGGASTGTLGTKIASLTITVSPFDRIVSFNKTSARVTFKNSGEVALNDISVNAYVKESDEISTALSQNKFKALAVGESANTTLTLTTFELTKDSYAITVTGVVNDPKFNQSTTIYIKPLFNETKLEQKLQFVKDLFQDNPECIDLMELIVQAEKEVNKNNVQKAGELTQAALDNCRDIIRYSNATRHNVTPGIAPLPLSEIIIGVLAVALFAVLAYLLIERRVSSRKVKT
jgi:hypothetical protein